MCGRYGVSEDRLVEIACHRAAEPIVVDGDVGKPAWRNTPRSPRFVDMVSGEPALYETRVACQWDEERFYVAYWVEEPQVRATLTERDRFIWNDNEALRVHGKRLPENPGWSLNPHGVYDSHIPESFSVVRVCTRPPAG